MKRPDGFDPLGQAQQPVPKRARAAQPARQKAQQRKPEPQAQRERPDRAALRKSTRERRRYERGEVRRFTRRSRNRRLAWLSVATVIGTLIGAVAIAVYSPILVLRTIEIDGTARLSAEEVHAVVDDQLDTPLALIDFDGITAALGTFPLIRSYVTETVPPDTLIIHIVEREPVGAILSAGVYTLVDPAGIVVQSSIDRVPGVPVVDLAGQDTSSPAFESVVEVLLALPASFLAQVDSITARSQDDVSLVLTGIGQRVAWGSADNSVQKAAVLAALVGITDPSRQGEFDVSAPSNGIFSPG